MKINEQPPITPATLGPASGPNEWAARLAAESSVTAAGAGRDVAPAAKVELSARSRELHGASMAPTTASDAGAEVAAVSVGIAADASVAASSTADPARTLPSGYPSVSEADQAYWSGRLAENPQTLVNSFDAATNLARWLDVEKNGSFLPNASGPGLSILPGTPRSPVSDQDLRIGLAEAQARAVTEGVTPDQLAVAQKSLADKLAAGDYAAGGTFGMADPAQEAYSRADYALSGGRPYSMAQIEYINRTGGATVDNLTRLVGDPEFAKLQ